MFQSDHMTELNNSDHMTELNNSDHIDKLVDMSWSDHMTVQNENSIELKCYSWTAKHFSNKLHTQLSQSSDLIIQSVDFI